MKKLLNSMNKVNANLTKKTAAKFESVLEGFRLFKNQCWVKNEFVYLNKFDK